MTKGQKTWLIIGGGVGFAWWLMARKSTAEAVVAPPEAPEATSGLGLLWFRPKAYAPKAYRPNKAYAPRGLREMKERHSSMSGIGDAGYAGGIFARQLFSGMTGG